MRKQGLILGLAALAVTAGCVIRTHHTIDAYVRVDIRHIQEQADQVLDFIQGDTDTLELEPAPDAASWLERGFRALAPVQVAYAQELKASSARVTQIASRMRERHPRIEAQKAKGYIGENNRGYAAIRPDNEPSDPEEKNELQRLVAEENNDRRDLYREIVALNQSDNVTLSQVERVYAQKRLERAKPGEIFQLPPAGRDFDAFKNSAIGRRLGDDAQPEAWVTIK